MGGQCLGLLGNTAEVFPFFRMQIQRFVAAQERYIDEERVIPVLQVPA